MSEREQWRLILPYSPPRSTGSWRTHDIDRHCDGEPREDCWRCVRRR